MIRLLKWLFTGDAHLHKWENISEERITRVDTGACVGFIYVQQCEKCGQMQKFEAGI
tara:strand:+ start:158 stop:328 length:171 start_codon:yes stop_codon:yes gene_type:complete